MTELDAALPGDTLAEVYKAWTLALAERDVALAERDVALAALDDIALMGREEVPHTRRCRSPHLCRRWGRAASCPRRDQKPDWMGREPLAARRHSVKL